VKKITLEHSKCNIQIPSQKNEIPSKEFLGRTGNPVLEI